MLKKDFYVNETLISEGCPNNIKLKIMKNNITLFLIFFMLIIISGTGNCTTYYVSKSGLDTNTGTTWGSSLLTIKTAISKTISGDSIWIAKGTYFEGEQLLISSNITLYGGFTGTETTLSERNFRLNKTIVEGNSTYQILDLRYSTIDGLYITKGSSTTDCGGIDAYHATITNCDIYENTGKSYGGGCNAVYSTITNSRIYANSGQNTYGGGIFLMDSTLTNCTIFGNTAGAASGVFCYTGSSVMNCTIVGNTTTNASNAAFEGSPITNSIIWDNIGRNAYFSSDYYTNCCVPDATLTNGNINSNPNLVNSTGDIYSMDLHLASGSPCIDAGKSTGAPATDLEGTTRPVGAGHDIGAYEFKATSGVSDWEIR